MRKKLAAYSLLVPSLLALATFLVLPIFLIIWLSFHEWDLLAPIRFVGFDNYYWLVKNPTLWRSLGISVLFVLLVIPTQTLLGLGLALLLKQNLPGTGLVRVLLLLPWICAPLALGVIWRWVLGYSNGFLNELLGVKIPWLTDPSLALPAVATVAVWQAVGYVALFFYAGLNAIDSQVYDAAALDGANRLQTFWYVTLPLLRPTTFFVLVTGIISSFQVFDIAYALTPNGGPQGSVDVIAGRIYYEAFSAFSLGRASVMALVLMLLLVAITLLQKWYFTRRDMAHA